jgi:WASH complex subunit strumpellin
MTEFLSEENVCGQTLLKIVARGSSILAEMQRLASCVPKVRQVASLDLRK